MNRIRSIAGCAWVALGLLSQVAADTPPRGGRVGWARIVTTDDSWKRHADTDGVLTRFIRKQTSLNLDPTWYSADPASVEQLCTYPLLFTNNLADVDPAYGKNVGEYLLRGGFLFVDACINTTITADPDAFLQQHIALMKRIAPTAVVRELPRSHDVYRQFFVVEETPPHTFMRNVYNERWARHGLYGIFVGERMAGLISVSGLQCGWAGTYTGKHAEKCMEMVVNIYVYAMTR